MNQDTRKLETEIYAVETTLQEVIRRKRRWYLVQGILFVLLGLVAFVLPVIAVLGVEIVLATLLIISGAYQTYQGITDRSGWLGVSGLLSLIVGVFMLIVPAAGVIALATLVAVFLFIEGIAEIVLSLKLRFSSRWGWLMVSGILSLILSVVLLIGWPEQTVFLVGIFLGINFVFYGASILAVVATIGKEAGLR